MVRSSVGREQWLAWVAEQAESGRSVQQFCLERQISVNSFSVWRRKSLGEKVSKDAALVPVSIARGSSQVQIELPCGAVVNLLVSYQPARSESMIAGAYRLDDEGRFPDSSPRVMHGEEDRLELHAERRE